ncbi:MAG: putative baseplate assembly protein [Caldilineaceae bacterium]
MTNETDTKLDTCGCCESGPAEPMLYNPPGQPALQYRIGVHSTFFQRMIAQLAQQEVLDGEHAGARPLAKLTARNTDDPAIALLDAWATVGDVLTFYQERIANEGYLRTATERRSVLELARAIGYELAPGVAAGVYLAFTVDESDATPDETTIAAGTQVQSIPTKEGELPQTFETATDFAAKVWWNKLRPQQSKPQVITWEISELYLQGTNLNLAVGDRLLLVGKDSQDKVIDVRRKRIRERTPDPERNHTLVKFEAESSTAKAGSKATFTASARAAAAPTAGPTQAAGVGIHHSFTTQNLDTLLGATLTESQFQVVRKSRGWQTTDVLDYANKKPRPTVAGPADVATWELYVLREQVGIFGHNAPHYQTLAEDARPAFNNWDNPDWQIWEDSIIGPIYYADADLYLERPISGILEDSWLLLERPGAQEIYRVQSAVEGSMTGFGISAKVTGLELANPVGQPLADNRTDKDFAFKVRKTTAYVKSEKLTLAQAPVADDLHLGATTLLLDGLAPGLQVGQPVALTGEQADAEGVLRSEIKLLAAINHDDFFTTLTFTEGLQYRYKRATVLINANVVHATHGETVANEVLGSGDGAKANQRFKLKKPPLTYVSAATTSGLENSLEVRVNGVAWTEVASLYGVNGKVRGYLVQHDNDSNAYVTFGDGNRGARLPTGWENVTATYRSGIGAAGEVDAGTLTLLKKRPFGVRSVVNPTAAAGAEDPETLVSARTNAPLTVLTLARIVSLQDFEDFARAFPGIGKARAVALWNGETELVHITIADASGDPVESTADLFKNLRDAVNGARDPLRTVEIGTYQPRYFDVAAKVLIDPTYRWADVKAAIERTLNDHFSFAARTFGQPVTSAEMINIIHEVAGVVAVDLDKLYQVDESGQPVAPLLSNVLSAQRARPNPTPTSANPARFLPAELLLINSAGITLVEMTVTEG